MNARPTNAETVSIPSGGWNGYFLIHSKSRVLFHAWAGAVGSKQLAGGPGILVALCERLPGPPKNFLPGGSFPLTPSFFQLKTQKN